MIKDQSARLAREPSKPLLLKVEDTWINPTHIIGLWWALPDTDKSEIGHTVIRMSDGSSITVHSPLEAVAATINQELQTT